MLQSAFFWGALGGLLNSAASLLMPERIRLASAIEDKTLKEAAGDYVADGEVYGRQRFRLLSETSTRFLYCSPSGLWSITGSEANIAKAKGTIVSTEKGDSPVG